MNYSKIDKGPIITGIRSKRGHVVQNLSTTATSTLRALYSKFIGLSYCINVTMNTSTRYAWLFAPYNMNAGLFGWVHFKGRQHHFKKWHLMIPNPLELYWRKHLDGRRTCPSLCPSLFALRHRWIMTEHALHFVHRSLRCIFRSALESGHLLGSTFGDWHSQIMRERSWEIWGIELRQQQSDNRGWPWNHDYLMVGLRPSNGRFRTVITVLPYGGALFGGQILPFK